MELLCIVIEDSIEIIVKHIYWPCVSYAKEDGDVGQCGDLFCVLEGCGIQEMNSAKCVNDCSGVSTIVCCEICFDDISTFFAIGVFI